MRHSYLFGMAASQSAHTVQLLTSACFSVDPKPIAQVIPQRPERLIIHPVPPPKSQAIKLAIQPGLMPTNLTPRVRLVHRSDLSGDACPLELALYGFATLLLQTFIPFHELVNEAQMRLDYNIQTAGAHKTAATVLVSKKTVDRKRDIGRNVLSPRKAQTHARHNFCNTNRR